MLIGGFANCNGILFGHFDAYFLVFQEIVKNREKNDVLLMLVLLYSRFYVNSEGLQTKEKNDQLLSIC